MNASASHNRLPALAADIRDAHAAIGRSAEEMARHALDAGRKLIEAKALVGHGAWASWLAAHAGMSGRTAQRYMQLARSDLKAATVAALGIRGAAERLAREAASVPLPPLGSYAIAIIRGETAVAVWRCPDQPERFHVAGAMGLDSTDGQLTGTRHPVPPELVRGTIEQGGFRIGCAPFRTLPIQGAWPEQLRGWAIDGFMGGPLNPQNRQETIKAIEAIDQIPPAGGASVGPDLTTDPAFLAWRDEMDGLHAEAPSPGAREQMLRTMRDQVQAEQFAASLREHMAPSEIDQVCQWLERADPKQIAKLLKAKLAGGAA